MAGMTFDHQLSFDPFAMSALDQQSPDLNQELERPPAVDFQRIRLRKYSYSRNCHPWNGLQILRPSVPSGWLRVNYSGFSPIGLFNPLDDFSNPDLTSDSAPSPGSPGSSDLGASYALPTADDWMAWDKLDQSPGPDFLKTEPFEDPILASVPAQSVSLSPAINPMDLANSSVEDVTLGQEGLNDNQPLFQSLSQPAQASLPSSSPATRSPVTVKNRASSSPEPLSPQKAVSRSDKRYSSRNLKRKSSCDLDDEESSQRSSASPPPALRRSSTKDSSKSELGPKKTAHNMIEKRYRTNLNDKIAALRDSVPALRVMVHKLEHQGSDDDADEEAFPGFGHSRPEDLGGLEPAHKLNKATILSKATEYIAHLERRNRNLAKENSNLRNKVDGFEMLMMGRGAPATTLWS